MLALFPTRTWINRSLRSVTIAFKIRFDKYINRQSSLSTTFSWIHKPILVPCPLCISTRASTRTHIVHEPSRWTALIGLIYEYQYSCYMISLDGTFWVIEHCVWRDSVTASLNRDLHSAGRMRVDSKRGRNHLYDHKWFLPNGTVFRADSSATLLALKKNTHTNLQMPLKE